MRSHLAPAWLALLLLVAACTGGGSEATTVPGATTPPTTAAGETTTTAAPTTTTTTTGEPTMPVGIDELPQAIQDQVVELVAVTEDYRELRFLEPPVVNVVSREELADRVRESILEDTEDVDADQALYVLLGLLEPGTDLLELYLNLYGEQVAGFYDGEERELVVPAATDQLTPLQQATLVHELTHALTDQHYEMWPRYEEMIDEQRYDESVAYLSVIEGDAVLTEIFYIRQLPTDQQQEILAESLAADSTALEQAPAFIRDSLLFPYQQGLVFVQRLHDLGGFEGVGEAYLEPPASSEQIITPRDFRRDEPLPVDHPDLTLAGYEEVYRSTWGELGFVLMFDQILGGRDAASDGWGGDEYQVWFDGTEVALALTYRGDTAEDATEMANALTEYVQVGMAVDGPGEAAGTFTGEDYAFVGVDGDQVWFVAASDPQAGEQLRSALAG